jgi:hypothetical protein
MNIQSIIELLIQTPPFFDEETMDTEECIYCHASRHELRDYEPRITEKTIYLKGTIIKTTDITEHLPICPYQLAKEWLTTQQYAHAPPPHHQTTAVSGRVQSEQQKAQPATAQPQGRVRSTL